MDKSFLYLIVLVFGIGICVISSKEVSGSDNLAPESKIVDYLTLDNTVNKELNSNESELESAQENDCKCKNGQCMRVCDVEKTIPCLNKMKVCSCAPEYAEMDGECKYCNCGEGFGCIFKPNTFGVMKKTCLCPNGYYSSYNYNSFDDYCKPECSETRRCQNGGSCNAKRCKCPWGITGDLCEDIAFCKSKCENRLELDINYNPLTEICHCTCKNYTHFYYEKENICKPCSCGNGYCKYGLSYSRQELKCICTPGWKEFNGFCKRCDCGFGSTCRLNSDGEKICTCSEGFYEREKRCLPCGCMSYSDYNTKCEIINNVKRCLCKEGFQDVHGMCEDVNECETDNPCHKTAICVNRYGSYECECPDGYKGHLGDKIVKAGEMCVDIDECKSGMSCWRYDNVKCVNLPGSYKCECLEGYEPISYTTEPSKTSCVSSRNSWSPALIVFFTTAALIGVAGVMHCKLKKRALRSN